MIDPRSAYRESAARGASAVGLVVLLYEQMAEDLRRARSAIDENNVEGRTNAINHAMVIASHLQSNLNFEVGGEVARNLERFYNMVRRRLLEAQFQGSKQILDEQISLVLDLRDAWQEVERVETGPPPPSSGIEPPEGATTGAEWKA